MFIVFLRFSENKAMASQFMSAHSSWIQDGIDDGTFLLVGSIKPQQGGFILCQGTNIKLVEDRINKDPFVRENIVTSEIIEVSPSRSNDQLSFLIQNRT